MALEALFWWSCQFYREWNRSSLSSPIGQQIPVSVKLNFSCTNNATKYEVCIVGLQVALEYGAYDLSIFRDSMLIISQIEGKWQAWDTKLIPNKKCVNRLISKFRNITFAYLPRAHNQFADALATLASMVKLLEGDDMRQLHIEIRGVPVYWMNIENAWVSKSKQMESHGIMISRFILKTVNTRPVQQIVKRSLFSARSANFSWVGKSYTKGTTILPCSDA